MKEIIIGLLIGLIISSILNYLYIKKSNTRNLIKNIKKKSLIKNAGNGLFAGKDYKKGDLIEINNFIILKIDNVKGLLLNYMFNHPNDENYYIVNLGNICLINHSKKNVNVDPYNFDLEKKEQKCFATRDIKKGEELLYNYGKLYIENHPEIKLND